MFRHLLPVSMRAAATVAAMFLVACSPSAPAGTPAAPPTTAASKPTAAPPGVAGSPAAAASPSTGPASSPVAVPAAAPSAGPTTTLRVGLGNASASNAGIYIADGLGYFAQQGLALSYVDFGSASEVMPALARGDLDIGDVGINPALFNAVARGFGIKLVADKGSMPPGFGFTSMVVATQLADTIKGPANLKGHTLAMTPPGLGTSNGFVLNKYLGSVNLTPNDVQIVPIAFPDQIVALANRSIDAAIMAEPFATRAVQNGSGTRLATFDQIDPGQQVAGLVYSDAFIAQHHDLAVAWMTAYVRGIRTYNAAFVNGVDKDRIVSILADKTGIQDTALWGSMIPAGLNVDGKLNEQSVADAAKYFQSIGLTPEVPAVSTYVDNSFTEAAVQALGPAH